MKLLRVLLFAHAAVALSCFECRESYDHNGNAIGKRDREGKMVERSEEVRLVNIGLRWRSEAKPFEKQARDGARRSEAKSSVGEEIEAPEGTQWLIMENRGQGELNRFGVDLQLKMGLAGSILSIFSVFKGKGRFSAGFRDTFPIKSEFEQERRFYPRMRNGNGGKVNHLNQTCPQWLNVDFT